jgi:hypothetical protein
MEKLDYSSLLNQMLNSAKSILADKWPAVKDLATSSFKTLAQSLVDIEEMRLNGTITEEQARLLLDMHKNTVKITLLSEEIIGIVAAEEAINAAIDSIRNIVNTAIGFSLL